MAEITVKDITTGSISGTGVFDELMASAQTRLDSQYKQNRIKGADYSKVYLGGMEAILMNSIQFILGRQEASAKADLILEQILTEKEQRKLVEAQISKMGKEEDLIDQQILKMVQEILVMKGEVSMIPHKIELLEAQVIKMQKEGDLIDGQIRKMEYEIDLMEQQVKKMIQEVILMEEQVKKMVFEIELMQAQAEKTRAEVKLVEGQVDKMKYEILVMEQQVEESKQKVETMKASVWAERAKTESSSKIFEADYAPLPLPDREVTGLVGNQIKKTDAEVILLAQKGLTEEAQTKDIVGKAPNDYSVTGVLGKQKGLYQKQTEGFDRDAEQKLSKIMVDSWNTRRISNDEENPLGTGLENPDICSVLAIAKAGIKANTEGCAGGGNTGEIGGVTVDIQATTDVLEDCHASFESHVTIDNLPGVSIRSWEWWSPEGRDLEHQGPLLAGVPGRFTFQTGFWEPGENPIILEIILNDTNTESEYHNHKIRFTKMFYATATDGGCLGGIRPTSATPAVIAAEVAAAAKYSVAHPEEHDHTNVWGGTDGVLITHEGHKG